MSQYQNKKVLNVMQQTRLNQDSCEKDSRIRNNEKQMNFKFTGNVDTQNHGRQNYLLSMNEVGLYHSHGSDGDGQLIDMDSAIRNGSQGNVITAEKSKATKLLSHRPYMTVPFMGAGKTSIVYPDVYSIMSIGEDTTTGRACNTLSGITIDRFIPLVPCLRDNVQNPVHLIPQYWVRGGMDTRAVIRNVDYMIECGYRR
jgi:hypothetical protein